VLDQGGNPFQLSKGELSSCINSILHNFNPYRSALFKDQSLFEVEDKPDDFVYVQVIGTNLRDSNADTDLRHGWELGPNNLVFLSKPSPTDLGIEEQLKFNHEYSFLRYRRDEEGNSIVLARPAVDFQIEEAEVLERYFRSSV
jgi:hypothetical protein